MSRARTCSIASDVPVTVAYALMVGFVVVLTLVALWLLRRTHGPYPALLDSIADRHSFPVEARKVDKGGQVRLRFRVQPGAATDEPDAG